MPSQPSPGSTGGSPQIPAALSAQAVPRVVDFKINEKLRPVTGAAVVSSPFLSRGPATPPRPAAMPSQRLPCSTGGSPRTPAPFQPAPCSTGGTPRIPMASLSAQAVSRVARRVTTLVDWWLERVEGEEGKIRVSGTVFTPPMSPQMRKGSSSSKENRARRVFRSSAIVKRLDYITIESEDGYHIRIGVPLNIPKSRENGFTQEVCECFEFGFPILWQGLVNPKMVPDNEHAQSQSETTSAPGLSVEDYMAMFLSDSFSSSIRYDVTENDFNSSLGYSGNTDGLTSQSLWNLPDDNAGNITASWGLHGLRMGVPEKPLVPPGEACNSDQESYQHDSTQIDASIQEVVNRSISSVSVKQSTGSISSNSKVDGNILAPSKISSVVNEGYRSTVGCGQAEEDADIQQGNMHSCSSELGTTDALELLTDTMTPKSGAVGGSEDGTGRRLRSGKVLGMPSCEPMKRGHKQKKIQLEAMVNQGATSTADLTAHENDFSSALVAVEEKLESHDSCRRGRGRPAEGKKAKRKGKRKRDSYFFAGQGRLTEGKGKRKRKRDSYLFSSWV